MRALSVLLLLSLLGLTGFLAWTFFAAGDEATPLRFSAGSATGEYYDFAKALAELTRTQEPRIEIQVFESEGALANERAVASGAAELGLVQSDTLVSPNVQAIAGVFPEILHLVARDAASIASPAGLGGKRIALMPKGSGSNALFFRVMRHYGYGESDFVVRYMAPDAAMAAVKNGEVDAMARVIALGNAGMRELLRSEGLSLVPVDQAEAIQMFAPSLERVVIPIGALNGRPPVPPKDIEALGVRAVLVVNRDVEPGVVTRLTELLFKSRNQLLELDEQTALLGGPDTIATLGFPIHAGAQSYFDADKPVFFVRYADVIALTLSLGALIASGLWQLKRWIDARRKNRGDAYNGELARAVDELRAARSSDQLDVIEEDLYRIFRKVIDDIDQDLLARETLPTFDFVWRSATELLAQRRADLRGGSRAIPALASLVSPPKRSEG